MHGLTFSPAVQEVRDAPKHRAPKPMNEGVWSDTSYPELGVLIGFNIKINSKTKFLIPYHYTGGLISSAPQVFLFFLLLGCLYRSESNIDFFGVKAMKTLYYIFNITSEGAIENYIPGRSNYTPRA